MPEDVYEAFQKVIESESNVSSEEADQYLKRMEATNRYQMETWS